MDEKTHYENHEIGWHNIDITVQSKWQLVVVRYHLRRWKPMLLPLCPVSVSFLCQVYSFPWTITIHYTHTHTPNTVKTKEVWVVSSLSSLIVHIACQCSCLYHRAVPTIYIYINIPCNWATAAWSVPCSDHHKIVIIVHIGVEQNKYIVDDGRYYMLFFFPIMIISLVTSAIQGETSCRQPFEVWFVRDEIVAMLPQKKDLPLFCWFIG